MSLEGKVAIVTGGGSGFGEGIVRSFVAAGARVIVADRDTASAERVASAVGTQAFAVTVDVSRDADVAVMVASAYDKFSDLDILVDERRRRPPAAAARGFDEGFLTGFWRSMSKPSTWRHATSCRASRRRSRRDSQHSLDRGSQPAP